MWIKDVDTTTTTLVEYIGPSAADHSSYLAAKIRFADNFDYTTLPKSVRAAQLMTINCTPKAGNTKNETGVKRLRRILKALEGTPIETRMSYSNSITEEEFFRRAA